MSHLTMLAGPSRIVYQPAVRRVERILVSRPTRQFTTSNRSSSLLHATAVRRAQPARRPRDAVADAERQLEKYQKRPQMAGFSADNQYVPLQDAYILPPLHEVGYRAPGGILKILQYVGKRIGRWARTNRSLYDLRSLGGLPEIEHQGRWRNSGLYKFFANGTPSLAGRGLVKELSDIYIRYNQAQASGDHQALGAVSQGAALALAKSRSPNASSSSPPSTSRNTGIATQRLEWSLEKMVSAPKLVNLRAFPIDQKSGKQLGQAIVRFESDQSLNIRAYSRKTGQTVQKQTSRVKEYYAFEREITNAMSKWRLREKVQPYTGGDFSKIL